MTNLGLLFIVLGWAYQAWYLFKGNKMIQPVFVGFYALGVLFLVVSSSTAISLTNFVSLDGISFILALVVFVLVLKKR